MAVGPRVQSAAGLDAVLAPRSVAVVGASPDPSSVGHRLFASILGHGFTGPVHPVHPRAKEVLGRPAFPDMASVPGDIDLAVLAVPAPQVLKVVRECAAKGVRGLLVVTAGFREAGAEGAQMETELGALARGHGMRLVGPNCLGVVNADPKVRLHAIFADSPARGGPVALMTQSGALGIALLDRADAIGLGIGRFVSMGNKLDVSGNDLLLHWEGDPDVRVIAMHLESIGNPRNFLAIARRVSRSKPIVLVKGGRTPDGAKAAGSHTGAMVEADQLVDALVRQAGVVRVGSVEELFDACLALSRQPLPAGPRVAVVTNSGGPAILLADALPGAGLRLASLGTSTLDACRRRLPAGAAISNPLDMLAGASPANLAACLGDLLADPGVDAVVAMVTPLAADDRPWADAVLEAARARPGKTLAAVLFGRDARSAGFRRLVEAGIPTYTFPENAVHALSALHRTAEARRGPAAEAPPPSAPPRQRMASEGWQTTAQSLAAVEGLGAAVLRMAEARSPQEAAAKAADLGFPVAVKVQADGLVHKTEAGAVRLGLASPEAVLRESAAAWAQVAASGHEPRGLLVQGMAPPGLEMIVGAVRDARYGPILSIGLGGIYTEALRDVAVALAPLGPEEADRLIDGLRAAPLLAGLRGEPPKDRAALRDVAVALGRLMADDPAIQELEVNPLRVLELGRGVVAVDARMRLAARPPNA